MRTMFLGSVALIAIGASVTANAADMAVKAPPPIPELPYNVVRPTGTPSWQLRTFFSLLFPER